MKTTEIKRGLIAYLHQNIQKIIAEHKDNLMSYKEAALDIVYPKELNCSICKSKLSNKSFFEVCERCITTLPFINEPFCEKCGKPKESELMNCTECEGVHHYFEQALSVFEYTDRIQRLIYRFKYGGEQHLSYTLGGFLAEKLKGKKDWDANCLVAVPLSKKRLRERGFNQSALVAEELSSKLIILLLRNALVRTKETFAQAGLGRQERLTNLRFAFQVKEPDLVKNKKIVLIDDIFTTGSTANECSRVLREAGASKVYVLTIATGRPNQLF